MATPTISTDAANKAYVDNNSLGMNELTDLKVAAGEYVRLPILAGGLAITSSALTTTALTDAFGRHRRSLGIYYQIPNGPASLVYNDGRGDVFYLNLRTGSGLSNAGRRYNSNELNTRKCTAIHFDSNSDDFPGGTGDTEGTLAFTSFENPENNNPQSKYYIIDIAGDRRSEPTVHKGNRSIPNDYISNRNTNSIGTLPITNSPASRPAEKDAIGGADDGCICIVNSRLLSIKADAMWWTLNI